MTAYNGSLISLEAADMPPSRCQTQERQQSKGAMSGAVVHGGTLALRLIGGGYYDVYYGCDAGSKTIRIWVFPPVIGKCALQVYDGPTLMGEAFNTAAGDWEQLSVTFMAVKKVYIVRLSNFALQDGDTRAYFDDLT